MAFSGAATQGPMPERRPAPAGLTLNLSSNNPFRNRALTPSPRSAEPSVTRFPMASNNPFLDASDEPAPVGLAKTANLALPDDIFKDLSLLDKPSSSAAAPSRAGLPPPRTGTFPVQGHRANGSGDKTDRSRGGPRRDSPNKQHHRPHRRASESSIMEKSRRPREDRERSDRPPRTESEERRRRERRREREERHRREKEKEKEKGGKSGSSGRTRRPQGLDIIDKLDVTGVYGQGLFHHDGPFDACNPHRNARRDRKAPMQAFPADSANMAIGGSGPNRSRLDLDKFHGRGEEGFNDFAATRKTEANVVDPTQRVDPVHGEETFGLGTSTFLEGAPASRSALQRRESDEVNEYGGGGLTRKKSLAQRFRGMSGSRPQRPSDYRSPEARYSSKADSPPMHAKASSAGGPSRARYNKENEINPFDNDYQDAFEKKGAQIRIAEQARPITSSGRQRGMSGSRSHGLVRTVTSDSTGPADKDRGSSGEIDRPSGGGFLSRMKSLKGGPRRTKVEA